MKKQTKKFIIIGLIILIFIGYFTNNYFHKKHKFGCQNNSDCIMSFNDPENFQICVNKNYYENLPKIKGTYQCIINKTLSCFCQQNKCVRSDRKVGCE